MSVEKKTSKAEKQMAVSMAVLEIIEKDGLLAVTHSKVARKSKVSRAWIYEYIGPDKKAFIEFAAELIATHFARITTTLPDSKAKLHSQLEDGVRFLFDSVIKDPVIIKIYFKFRGTENPIGQVIQKYEKQWQKSAAKSATDNFKLSEENAKLFAELAMTLRLGYAHRIVTSESVSQSRLNAEKTFAYIHSMITSMKPETL